MIAQYTLVLAAKDQDLMFEAHLLLLLSLLPAYPRGPQVSPP
jgi:hypothetical protein